MTDQPIISPEDELLTIHEAAAILRMPVGTLRYMRHEGRGPYSFKMGRHVRYRRGDITAYIEAQYHRDDPGAA